MPTYDSSSAGVELRVTSAGRPQGKGPLTSADVSSAFEAGAIVDALPAVSDTVATVQKQVVVHVDYTDIEAQSNVLFGPTFPDNTIVTRMFYEVDATFKSGTDAATIGIGFATDDAAGLVATAAISAVGDIWDAGYHDGIQNGAASNFGTKLTAARKLQFIRAGGEDLTAGSMTLYVEYVVGAA